MSKKMKPGNIVLARERKNDQDNKSLSTRDAQMGEWRSKR